MLHPHVSNMLKQLENLMRDGALTRAVNVDSETLICFTESVPGGGQAYHQFVFEQMPRDFQMFFKGQSQGAKVGPFKIVAVFDVWPDAINLVPPVVKKYMA